MFRSRAPEVYSGRRGASCVARRGGSRRLPRSRYGKVAAAYGSGAAEGRGNAGRGREPAAPPRQADVAGLCESQAEVWLSHKRVNKDVSETKRLLKAQRLLVPPLGGGAHMHAAAFLGQATRGVTRRSRHAHVSQGPRLAMPPPQDSEGSQQATITRGVTQVTP